MKNTRDNQLSDRRAASADAKSALLNAYRAAQLTAAPAKAARQAERALVAAARDERRQARERIKMEEETRIATEAAERQAQWEQERQQQTAASPPHQSEPADPLPAADFDPQRCPQAIISDDAVRFVTARQEMTLVLAQEASL